MISGRTKSYRTYSAVFTRVVGKNTKWDDPPGRSAADKRFQKRFINMWNPWNITAQQEHRIITGMAYMFDNYRKISWMFMVATVFVGWYPWYSSFIDSAYGDVTFWGCTMTCGDACGVSSCKIGIIGCLGFLGAFLSQSPRSKHVFFVTGNPRWKNGKVKSCEIHCQKWKSTNLPYFNSTVNIL